jgi:methionine-rich copper-binding protein CopC
MKFLIKILLFLFLSPLITFGQGPNQYQLKSTFQVGDALSTIEVMANGDTVLNTKVSTKNTITNNIEITEKIYKGTPLYGNAWFSLSSIFLDGHQTKGNLAFDLVKNEVQFSPGDISKAIVIKPDSFIVNNVKFVKLKKKYAGAFNGFYQKIVDVNNLQIFKQYNANYRPAVMGQKTGYEMATNEYEGNFIKTTALFMALNENWTEVKPNKATFKNFGDQKEIVEKYAKEKDLNVKKESDLIEIVKYYSTLKQF